MTSLFGKALRIFRSLDVGPRFVLLPVALAMVAASFEALSAGLLIPVLTGLVEGNFDFLQNSWAGRLLWSYLPEFLRESTLRTFISLIALIVIATSARLGISYLAQIIYIDRLKDFAHLLRAKLFTRSVHFGKKFYDTNKPGELHNTVLNFTQQIVQKLQLLHSQFQWLLMLFGYVGLMLMISVKLTMLVCVMFPLFYFSLSSLLKKIRAASNDFASADNTLGATFHDILSNITLVQASGTEEMEIERFAKNSRESSELYRSIYRNYLLIYPIQEVITLILTVTLVCIIAAIVMNNPAEEISPYLVYLYLMKRCSTAISAVGDCRGVFAYLDGLFDRVCYLLEDEDKAMIKSGEKTFSALKQGISIQNLSFEYSPNRLALNDISMDIEQGKLTALVGPSGSGKSTITHLLLRFYEVPKNSILIDGVCISEYSTESLRKNIARVSQSTEMFNQSLRYNIAYGLTEVSDERLTQALEKARLLDFVNALPLGLDTVIGDRGVQLSGGEKQRVSIARALLRDPEILILDEATSSLDANTELLVQEALDELIVGRTVLVIAHRFATIKNADRIITIADGEVLETGSLDELVAQDGTFASLWKAQELFY